MRYFDVEADSISEVKRMYEEDERQLGPAYDSDILRSDMSVSQPDGTWVDAAQIDLPEEPEEEEN